MTDNLPDVHAGQPLLYSGAALEQASAAMILLHGRGASAESILDLAEEFPLQNTTFLAPQAGLSRWYPQSFLAPLQENQPDLDLALGRITRLVTDLISSGIRLDRIWLAGFSQGACLAAEYMARSPARYGGLLVFSGGLIGPPGTQWNPYSNFAGMPVFIGCSDRDPHIPLQRVQETAAYFSSHQAQVECQIYPNMGHTINAAELDSARRLLDTARL